MWSSVFLCLLGVLSASAFSKYGRSCKDIGCLNSETCIMAEEPCSYGRTSECGAYPTCKKKSATDLANSPVEKPSLPQPIAPIRPAQPASSGHDDLPNYAPPPPPRGGGYGGSSGGYGGGSNGGYGGGSNGGYGGGSSGGYGGGSSGGYGGGSSGGYGGGSSGGYGNHGSGSNGGGGGGGLFGNTNGGSSQGGGFSDSLGSLFGNSGFGSLFGNSGSPGSNPGSAGANGATNPITSILSGILSNFTKNGLPSLSTLTRPGLIENKNNNPNPYGTNTYGYNDPNAGYNNQKQGIYPSLNSQPNSQGQPTQQNGYVAKNYGQSSSANAKSSAYTTRRSVNYGWTLGVGLVFISLTKLFI